MADNFRLTPINNRFRKPPSGARTNAGCYKIPQFIKGLNPLMACLLLTATYNLV